MKEIITNLPWHIWRTGHSHWRPCFCQSAGSEEAQFSSPGHLQPCWRHPRRRPRPAAAWWAVWARCASSANHHFHWKKNKKTNHNRRMTTDGKHWLNLLGNSRSAHMLLTVHSWSSRQKHDRKRGGLKGSHAEMRPVERPLMSLYSFHDSMLALWGATPSARSTSATMSRSAMETTSWGPKRDLKIFPNIFLCFICWVTVTQMR